MLDRLDRLKPYRGLLALLVIMFVYGAYAILSVPRIDLGMIESMPQVVWWSGISVTAAFFLLSSAAYCLLQWWRTGMQWCAVWGASFFLYSLVFIGVVFNAFNIVNTHLPNTFFLFRQVMILWAVGMFYGLVSLRTDHPVVRYWIPSIVLAAGYAWFGYGLFSIGDIQFTMYGFLSFLFIPITITLGYLFFRYSSRIKGAGMRWLSGGMFLMGTVYMVWAPMHQSVGYIFGFFLFNIALALIFVGITHLPYEKMQDVKHPLKRVV